MTSCFEKSGLFVLTWNDNSHVTVISNVHTDLPCVAVKRWNPGTKTYITVNRPNCITEYNKHMGGVDSLDALVSVYRIDVRGKKWYWHHYINIIDVFKSAAFNVFKIANPDAKINFLSFTRRLVMHYLKMAKIKEQILPNIIS